MFIEEKREVTLKSCNNRALPGQSRRKPKQWSQVLPGAPAGPGRPFCRWSMERSTAQDPGHNCDRHASPLQPWTRPCGPMSAADQPVSVTWQWMRAWTKAEVERKRQTWEKYRK